MIVNGEKYFPVIESLHYEETLKEMPLGTIVLITDPDHDRLTVTQIMSKNDIERKISKYNSKLCANLSAFEYLIKGEFEKDNINFGYIDSYIFQYIGYLRCIKDLGQISEEEFDYMQDALIDDARKKADEIKRKRESEKQ